MNRRLLISIVSHAQGELIAPLLLDLVKLDFSLFSLVTIVVTLNLPEDEKYLNLQSGGIRVTIIRNVRPQGFGANHNQAFSTSDSDYFLVLNPDVRLSNSFADRILVQDGTNWGCIGPLVLSADGETEDSARKYPTIARLVRRVILNQRQPDYTICDGAPDCEKVDWIAGMFMMFKSRVFVELKGFDARFFMYLEDADICRRINKIGYCVVFDKSFSVIHEARRNSFKNKSHLYWHLRSVFRFLFKI